MIILSYLTGISSFCNTQYTSWAMSLPKTDPTTLHIDNSYPTATFCCYL